MSCLAFPYWSVRAIRATGGWQTFTSGWAILLTIRLWYSALVSEERKFALLLAATILAARKLAEIGELADRPCPAREAALADAIRKSEAILRKIDSLYPAEEGLRVTPLLFITRCSTGISVTLARM